MSTIGAESISDEEAAPGQAAVTVHGGADGKTVTMSVPGGEASGRKTQIYFWQVCPSVKWMYSNLPNHAGTP